MKSLRNKRYKNEVSLSSYVWKIKNETGKIPTLNGQLQEESQPIRILGRNVNSPYFLHEKLEILM